MKRLYMTLISLIIVISFPVFFASTSKAAMSLQEFKDKITNEAHFTIPSGHDQFLQNILDSWQGHEFDLYVANDSNRWLYFFASYNNDAITNQNNIVFKHPCMYRYLWEYNGTWTEYNYDNNYANTDITQYYSSYNYFVNFGSGITIDYENPVFSSAIPVPDMTVTFVGVGLTLPSNTNGVYVDCIVPQEDAFYIQLQAKYSVCDLVQINLNNGVISYDYLDWTDGDNIDIYGFQDNESSVHVTASDFQTSWNTLINGLVENSSFPQFTSNVPFWVQNPTAQKYVDAQNRYKNVLMRQAPLYGSRMELFARYYAIVDNSVYVGKWIHWNSANPSNTEELSNKYQQDQPFPGFQNTSSDNNLPDQEDTYTNFGENTSVDNNPYSQVIINNNVPNYPDYPTAVSYNHDNILVQFITTAKQLPTFFGDFGTFLTSSFSFIPSEIWLIVGFGFMCSIVVMIIKVI